ncbi:MAG TPA: hypothetical protein VMZ50_04525, partial [Phycisphaerae bacterium]|nr:hypothetical protein [Phycisphaerae bacterium]
MPFEDSPQAGEGPRDCGTFFLDVVGKYAPGQIILQWSDRVRSTNDQVDQLIEQTWKAETARTGSAGQKLFNGKLCRLLQCTATKEKMTLTVGAVSYREFLGTNLRSAYIRYVYGPEVLADPLGVSAAVVAGDGFLVLGRRSRHVVCHPGRIHPIGGMVEP